MFIKDRLIRLALLSNLDLSKPLTLYTDTLSVLTGACLVLAAGNVNGLLVKSHCTFCHKSCLEHKLNGSFSK